MKPNEIAITKLNSDGPEERKIIELCADDVEGNITKLLSIIDNPMGLYINKYIEQLQAENAELRERVERSVVLPCAWGTKVWFIVNDEFYVNGAERKGIYEGEVVAFTGKGNGLWIWCAELGSRIGMGFDDIYLTREQAQTALEDGPPAETNSGEN